jgi:glycine/D-amino acid oxidase-like deaminating enzyme
MAILGITAGVGVAGLVANFYKRGYSLGPGNSRALPIDSDLQLPAQADAVVIGGGVTGAMAALCLAERGLTVALCEKGVIGGESSGRATGMVDSMFLSPAKSELVLRAKSLWPDLNARVGANTGYVKSGFVAVLQSEEEVAAAKGWVNSVQGVAGLDPEVVSCSRLPQLAPTARCHALLIQPSDGTVEPRFVAPAMTLGARARGVSLHQHCAARGIERSGGAVSAVVTERGIIRTKLVLLAGGVWSPLFMGNLGLQLPQSYAFASNQRVSSAPGGPMLAGVCGRTLWRREADGGYTVGDFRGLAPVTIDAVRYARRFLPALRSMPEIEVGIGGETYRSLTTARHWSLDEVTPFEKLRIMDATPNNPGLDDALANVRQILPTLSRVQLMERYAGALTMTPDNMPVISPISTVPGLLVAAGLYFGITISPSVGELLADLATGATPKVDPKPFRYERLIDGTKLEFQF